MKSLLRQASSIVADLPRAPSYFLNASPSTKLSVVYLVEKANWSIKWDGIHTTSNLRKMGRSACIATSSRFRSGSILHYGSSYVFETQFGLWASSENKHIVTFFHGRYGDDPLIDRRFEMLKSNLQKIDVVAYANSIMKQRFLDLGVPEEKLFYVPIGVDPAVFKPLSEEARQQARKRMGIPSEAFVIGSFQKDGEGWGDGCKPKLIKGPDIFIEALKLAALERPVFCLLSGPARGYVKRGLQEAGIPYLHKYYENPDDVVELYQLLDAYLVSSREEGGPKAILESLACGVPLVTTDVGMAQDVLKGHDCGFIRPSEDVEGLAQDLLNIASDPCISRELHIKSVERASAFSWAEVAKACEAMYSAVELQPQPGKKIT